MDMDDLQLFVQERVRQLHVNCNISARELSLAIGQGHGYISQIENGVHLPSLEGLLYICDYFGITMSEFFNEQIEHPEVVKEIVELALSTDTEVLTDIICLIKKIRRMQEDTGRKNISALKDTEHKAVQLSGQVKM